MSKQLSPQVNISKSSMSALAGVVGVLILKLGSLKLVVSMFAAAIGFVSVTNSPFRLTARYADCLTDVIIMLVLPW